ncbi:Carcinoembryonic antigen-related cell adhesion molecule 1 [Beauveria bassiana]|nr:Carcinoembryonic antigen-related cell adhesion molecule 1 [Beauveria bassiana]KAH8718814.1 Carcinoembryonic antigen-related cell adhesion molecule 1 [Beauveria bassiana]
MSSKSSSTTKSETTSTLPPLHSFPSSWTAPTSCFASTNYYRVLYADGKGRFVSNMYGTPTPVFTGNTPSGDCFPPSFTINVPYLTDGSACPTGYTRACATAGSANAGESAAISTITCCPRRHRLDGCHHRLGCHTGHEEPVTRTPSTKEGIEAWGIKFLSVAPGSTATSIPKPGQNASDSDNQGTQSPESSSSAGGLSGGAIAGIVVGSIAGVALLAIGAFLLYRRKSSNSGPQYHAPAPGKYPNQPANDPYQPSEMEAASPDPTQHAQPQTRARQEPVELSA